MKMFTEEYQEKTEPATPRKREEVRSRGYVPLSVELNSALTLLGFFAILSLVFFSLISQTKGILYHSLTQVNWSDLNLQSFHQLFIYELTVFLKIILPLLLIPLALGVITNLLQTNFLFVFKSLFSGGGKSSSSGRQSSGITPKLSRIFSSRVFSEGIKLCLKTVITIFLTYLVIRNELSHIATLSDRGADDLFFYLSSVLFKLGFTTVLVFLLFGLGDYLFQRWQYEKDIRMSREELKRELREEEGSPEVKGWIRGFMEEKINNG
jgi:flagellar biosynthetic protein FlhB